MVRMAQDFSLRYPLVNGQGNFGSMDGDNAAAYRYTEAKMTKLAEFLLSDIEKQTVDFKDNFDTTKTRTYCSSNTTSKPPHEWSDGYCGWYGHQHPPT